MQIPEIKLPRKISPCPIREAIVELRFDSKMPIELIRGLLFNKLKTDFSSEALQKLPVSDIPALIRENNEQLKYSPHYQFANGDFLIKLSPKSVSISCKDEYKGWATYFKFVKKIIAEIEQLDIIEKPQRVGLRYISFFENLNIFEKIKVNLKIFDSSLTGSRSLIRSEFPSENFFVPYRLQIWRC